MRKVQLSNFTKEKNDYLICFTDDLKYKFKSKRKAEEFLKQTNKFLDTQIQGLNLVYIDLFLIYSI